MIRPLTNRRRFAYNRLAKLLAARRNRKQRRASPQSNQGWGGSSPMAVPQMATPNEGQKGGLMNNGGEQNLPPAQGNPFSPTGGNGMDNLNNTIKRNRPKYY